MIVLDTHAWIWWVHDDEKLTPAQRSAIEANEDDIIGISAISCWEIAKLVEYGRLTLPLALAEWLEQCLELSRHCCRHSFYAR